MKTETKEILKEVFTIFSRWFTIIAITLLTISALQNSGQDINKVVTMLSNVILGCMIVTICASICQWTYTKINFTKSNDNIKILGYIFFGCALVYFGYLVGGYKTLFIE